MNKIYFLIILLLSGCEIPYITGKVIKKDIDPEHTETTTLFVSNQNHTISTILIPYRVPTRYYIVIETDCMQDKFFLEKDDWDSYNVGDKYPHLEKPDLK